MTSEMSEGLPLDDKAFQGREKAFLHLPSEKQDFRYLYGWVITLLHSVYSNANKDAAALVSRTTRAIRAMAASLAFTSQINIDKILKYCSWISHTTFLEFYLKDLTQVHDDLHSLGPIVAAQKVVMP